VRCKAFVPASLSLPDPVPSARASSQWGQPVEEPGKQAAKKSGSGPLHWLTVSESPRPWAPRRGCVPGGDTVPGLGAQGGGGEPPWRVRCPDDECPRSASPWLSPPLLPCSRVRARTGAPNATQGTLGGPGSGDSHVPQSPGSATRPGCRAGRI